MKTILAIDPDAKSLEAVLELLSSLPLEIQQAKSTTKALDVISQGMPDLLLLDADTPSDDDVHPLQILRKNGCKCPVLLLTAKSNVALIQSLIPLGVSDCIVKPYPKDELLAKVSNVLEKSGVSLSADDSATASAGADKPTHDILLIDDLENVAKRLQEMLPDDLSLDSCLDSKSAIQKCREGTYRAIIVDLIIPGVADSAALGRQLRTLQPNAAVVALALRKMKNPVATARAMGFDGALIKPFGAEQLDEFLATHLKIGDLFEVEQNLITVFSPPERESMHGRFFIRIGEAVGTLLDQMADACEQTAVLDLSKAPTAGKHPRFIVTAKDVAADVGIELRLVGGSDLRETLQKVAETASVGFFDDVDAARKGNTE